MRQFDAANAGEQRGMHGRPGSEKTPMQWLNSIVGKQQAGM
jgi:hypothetical protein